MSDRHLRRKLTVKAGGRRVVLVKKPRERIEHVWMKALLWALYLPQYPHAQIEVRVPGRYKPDVVQTDPMGRPVFWAEAGQNARAKLVFLFKRYPDTHFVFGKWGGPLAPHEALLRGALAGATRRASVELIGFSPDAGERFIDPDGTLRPRFEAVERRILTA